MKNLKQSIKVMLLLVVAVSYGQKKMDHGHNHNKHKADMNMMENKTALEFNNKDMAASYGHYLHIKTALVSSNGKEAQNGAVMLTKSLKGVKDADKALKAAKGMSSSADLNTQRTAFSDLSNAMAVLVKGNLKSGTVYKGFCPMALNGGAYWLSSEKEIQNPYYGDKMLKCGSVKEVIQ